MVSKEYKIIWTEFEYKRMKNWAKIIIIKAQTCKTLKINSSLDSSATPPTHSTTSKPKRSSILCYNWCKNLNCRTSARTKHPHQVRTLMTSIELFKKSQKTLLPQWKSSFKRSNFEYFPNSLILYIVIFLCFIFHFTLIVHISNTCFLKIFPLSSILLFQVIQNLLA